MTATITQKAIAITVGLAVAAFATFASISATSADEGLLRSDRVSPIGELIVLQGLFQDGRISSDRTSIGELIVLQGLFQDGRIGDRGFGSSIGELIVLQGLFGNDW